MAIRAGTTLLLLPRNERPRGYVERLARAFAQHKTNDASVEVERRMREDKTLSSTMTVRMVTLQNVAAQSCFVCSAIERTREVSGR